MELTRQFSHRREDFILICRLRQVSVESCQSFSLTQSAFDDVFTISDLSEGTRILYRSILLPMSDDGHTICGLLGAANFREVEVTEP